MKRPSFLQGALVALVLSLFGGALFATLGPVVGSGAALRAMIALLALAYGLYLMSRSAARIGRVVTVALWLLVSGLLWVLAVPLPVYALVHVGMVWLIRSLYLYSSSISALCDLALCAAGAVAAVGTVIHTGSLFLALWCFFLVQALASFIPASLRARNDDVGQVVEERFDRARRAAEAALERIYAAD